MPIRATKRGVERTPLQGEFDVLVCGASFAGLAVCRELSGAGPTAWLEALGLESSIRQTFPDLVFHTPLRTFRWRLPWTFSTFDYRELCALLRAQSPDVEFETAKVESRDGSMIRTDRGPLAAPLIVDALGWR